MAEVDLGRVQGFSAYEVAKQNGYVGTEAQWLESLHGPKGADGAPGKDGADGASAGFGTPMASVDANVGTPSVTIEASGSNAAKVFNFIFKNLKGEKGEKGERGPAGSVVVDDALSSTSVNPVQNKVVKAEFDNVNSNLDGLGYGEYQGGSNIAWISKERVISDIGVQATYFDGGVSIRQNGKYNNFQIKVPCKRNTKYNYGLKGYSDGNLKQFTIGSGIGYSWDNIIKRYVFTDSETLYSGSFSTGDYDFLTVTLYASSDIASGSMTIKDFYISETDMSYEPYIPSVKMLAEEVDNVNESLSVIGKCKNLLNPTRATTTVNGITCTNNGDGTITLNGTASVFTTLRVSELKIQEYLGKTLRLVGCPKNGSATTYQMFFTDNQNSNSTLTDLGEGATKIVEQWGSAEYWICYVAIQSGVTVSNLVFKPMLTEYLTATYDDFVPYTGEGDTLTADVAEIKNDLSNIKDGTTPAAKAVADEDGNNIKSTYAKKTEIPGGGSTAENVTVAAVSGVSQSVINNSKCKNDRVVLGFYITVAAGTYNTIRIADIMSDHGPTEVVYGTAICTTKYSGFDEYTKPYPFQINKAKSIYLKINETFATNMTFYISLAYDI